MASSAPDIDANQLTRGVYAGSEVPSFKHTIGLISGNSPFDVNANRPALNIICKADLTRDDLSGLTLGPYALGPIIGGGGMGKVFSARHIALDKAFAIKFISSHVNGRPELQLRFEQEVRALGKLQHPHILNAVDAGTVAGMHYLVTELVAGEDLVKLVQRVGAIPIRESCELIRQVAAGLGYSHRAGFLHRDIKPSNIILSRSGIVKIVDFGLVRSTEADHSLTMEGEMLGTWDYVAPEQAQDARHVDHRCDIYSLGCTLLYLLSGQPPFSNAQYSTAAAKLKGHLYDQPVWLEKPPPEVSPELAKILARMLAKNPSQRFSTAEEVASALAPLAAGAQVADLFTTNPLVSETSHICRAQRSIVARAWKPVAVSAAVAMVMAAGIMLRPSTTKTVEKVEVNSVAKAVEPEPVQPMPIEPTPASATPTASKTMTAGPVENAPPKPVLVTRESKNTFSAGAIRVKIPSATPKSKPKVLGAGTD